MKRYALFAYYLLCIYILQPPTDTVIKLILGGRDVAAKAKIQNILADSLQSFILSARHKFFNHDEFGTIRLSTLYERSAVSSLCLKCEIRVSVVASGNLHRFINSNLYLCDIAGKRLTRRCDMSTTY